MQHTNTRKLVESALMIALATVLSLLKLADLPYGGSITFASMLPIALISYRNGLGWGLGSGLAYGVLQQLLGLKTLTYVTGAPSVIAVIVLDYLLAFTVIGLAGMFRRAVPKQSTALSLGVFVTCVLRYACHVVSGATVWAGLSIPTTAALGYSFIYNATYMVPETIVTVLAAYYLASLIDFRELEPKRLARTASESGTAAWLGAGAALIIFAGVIFDVVAIFSKLQDAETGEFNITLLADSSLWIQVGIVTALVALAAAALYIGRNYVTEKKRSASSEESDPQAKA